MGAEARINGLGGGVDLLVHCIIAIAEWEEMIGGWERESAVITLVVEHAGWAERSAVQHGKKRHAGSQTLNNLTLSKE